MLGGYLTQHVSWQWIFWINLPVGVATMALGAWAIPSRARTQARRLDLAGLGALDGRPVRPHLGADRGERPRLDLGRDPRVVRAVAVAALAFVVVERRVAQPMVDVTLFARREFTGGIVALMLWAFGLFGIYFFTSLYLQGVLGFSPTKAGLAFVPMAVLMAASAIVSDRVAARFGAHRSTGFGMLADGSGDRLGRLLGRDASFWSLMPSFAVIGLGGGMTDPADRDRPGRDAGGAGGGRLGRSSTPRVRSPACSGSP